MMGESKKIPQNPKPRLWAGLSNTEEQRPTPGKGTLASQGAEDPSRVLREQNRSQLGPGTASTSRLHPWNCRQRGKTFSPSEGNDLPPRTAAQPTCP